MCSRREVHEALIDASTQVASSLDPTVRSALTAFAAHPPPSGALLLAGLPIGELPATPAGPTVPFEKDFTSETTLLAVATSLGEPVGYLPEHGGELVQNLVPTVDGADRQISTSSKVDLEFHTETAFHPYLPRYLLLLCLRGDPLAVTTLCSVAAVLPHLSTTTIDALRQPRFRCGVDESFTDGHAVEARPPAPILRGDPEDPCLTFDADLMVGIDAEAQAAVTELRAEVAGRHEGIVLEAGDLLVVDNARAVHGRSAYAARFDGTDRWLQRTFVVDDLGPSAADRQGRVIATTF